MVPAQDDLERLAYLLCGDQRHADALVRATLAAAAPATSAATPTAATRALVRAWLADPGAGPDPADTEPDTEPRTGTDLDKERLRRALGELTPGQRAAVVLRFWSRLSSAAAAEVLDRPEPAVVLDTTAALDVLVTEEERLTAGLGLLAADARPAPVDLAGLADAASAGRRRRWRSVGVAGGVLVAAGVFAAVLVAGEPAVSPRADTGWSPPPTAPDTRPAPSTVGPVLENPARAFDNRARRLTAQLAAHRARVLPGDADPRPAPVPTADGDVLWAPLVFHVSDTPDLYLAVAMLGAGHDATMLKIDVGYRDPLAEPRYTPCPEFEQDCTYRRFPDGTYGAVTVFTEPVADQTIHRLTVMRPDGTFCHVAVFYRERRADPPPLGRDDLFRFATVFAY